MIATKNWVCLERNCRRIFRRKYHLLRHQENTHAQARPYSCNICSRSFGRHDALLRHVRFHNQRATLNSRERATFACNRCHNRKVRCDNRTPCLPCQKDNAECQRHIQPATGGHGSSFDNIDHSIDSAESGYEPSQDNFHTTIPNDLHSESPVSVPGGQSTFEQGPILFVADHQSYTQSDLSPSNPAEDISPAPRSGSDSLDHDGGALEFVESHRLLRSIRYMSPTTIVNHEPHSTFNPPAVGSSVRQLNSTSAQLTPDNTSPASDNSSASYSSFHTEKIIHPQYRSHIDDEETITALSDHNSTIHSILNEKAIKEFFYLVHPHWPILHQETFLHSPKPLDLRCSVALLGSLREKDLTTMDALKALHKALSWRLETRIRQEYENPTTESTSQTQLFLAQALLLNILFGVYLQEKSLLSTACLQMGNLLSWVRHIGFLHIEDITAQDDTSGTEWSQWILRELKMRIAFATFRLECHLNFLHDIPPAMRFQEIEIPFVSTEVVWNTSTAVEWEQSITQEPPNRTQASFSTLCSLALSPLSPTKRLHLPGFFTAADFELGMCAMQSRLWEETKKYQIASRSVLDECELNSMEIASLHGYGQSWPVLLEIWRVTMEQFFSSSQGYLSVSSEKVAYLTGTLLYHASMLRAYADVSFLRRFATCFDENKSKTSSTNKNGTGLQRPPPCMRHHETRLQKWTRSDIAHDALWHAAQILHLAIQHIPSLRAQEVLLPPVVAECLFRAALIVWAFCRSRFICSLCAPLAATAYGDFSLNNESDSQSSIPRISRAFNRSGPHLDLTNVEKHSDQYNQWLREEGRPTYIENTLVCTCAMPDLLERYIHMIQESTVHHNQSITPTYVGILENLKSNR